MRFPRCLRALASLALLSILSAGPAHSQGDEFPNRSMRLVIPWPAGGLTDLVGRVIAQHLGTELGQAVVVDNRPGASGKIGTLAAMRSPPDGYTLYLGNGASMSVLAAVDPTIPYDPQKDFSPIALLSESPVALLTRVTLPVDNLQQFVALAKAEPNKLTFASPGTASTFHLLTELFNARAGIQALHVPYQGSAPATNAVIAGTVDFQLDVSGREYVDAKQMKALAATGSKRWFLFPEIPTFAEAGISGLERGSWMGLFAPANTPEPVIRKLNAAVNAALAQPGAVKILTINGHTALGGSADDLRDYLNADLNRWKNVVATVPSLQKKP